MCNNKCQTVTRYISLHCRGRGTSPVPRQFKYIGQPSPAPLLESALSRSWL